LADLDEVDDTARRERDEQRQRLQRKLADTARNRTTSYVKPRTPTHVTRSHGLKQRYNDLETERQTLLTTIAESGHEGQSIRPALSIASPTAAMPSGLVRRSGEPSSKCVRVGCLVVHWAMLSGPSRERRLRGGASLICGVLGSVFDQVVDVIEEASSLAFGW
jgi:hypothetical protein